MTQTSVDGEHRIIVGVDGSSSSKAALAWAIGQARISGAAVEAVMAWEFPAAYGAVMAVPDDLDFAKVAAEVVDDALGEIPHEGVTVKPRIAEGNPAQVLLKASEGADMLVVGSRGHSGFTEALLGSVGQHCVHHATCPVVVIRGSASR